jgi:hypothetical protein
MWIQMSVIERCCSFIIFLNHLFLSLVRLNCLYHSSVNFNNGSMDYCQWKVSLPMHIFVQHMERSLCNVRTSHLLMGLMMVKWGGRVLKLWCEYHLLSIILYFIYWHLSVIYVLCILTAFWCWLLHHLPSLHILPFVGGRIHCTSFVHSVDCCTHMLLVDMCFIFFIVSCSLVGSPVVDISTATNKWKCQSYRSELQRRK